MATEQRGLSFLTASIKCDTSYDRHILLKVHHFPPAQFEPATLLTFTMWWSVVGTGASSFVTCTDKNTVLKSHQVWEDGEIRASLSESFEDALAREAFIYQHLGPHPNILTCYGLEEIHPGIHALRLELAPLGNVRDYIRKHKDAPPPKQVRLSMALDAAKGLSYVHSRQVQHSDMSCRNLLLFGDYRVKLCDFGCSIVQGYDFKITNYEEAAYELPLRGRTLKSRPIIKRELFALGSAIYEIMAWVKPFEGDEITEIEEKLANEVFPDLEGVGARDIIRMCWDEKYEAADEVVDGLREMLQSYVAQVPSE